VVPRAIWFARLTVFSTWAGCTESLLPTIPIRVGLRLIRC
jgi:hypothetical protein